MIEQDVFENMLTQLHQMSLKRTFLLETPDRNRMRGVDFYPYGDFIRTITVAAQAFKDMHGFAPSIIEPNTINEHIFYRKFFSFHSLPSLSNKLAAREFVRNLVGDRFVTEMPWTGKTLDTLWDSSIQPGRYFLKANHGNRFQLQLNIPDDLANRRGEIIALADRWMNTSFGPFTGEWQYGTYAPQLFLEKFVDLKPGAFPDEYCFFCFDGHPRIIEHMSERPADKQALFDTAWNMYPVTTGANLAHAVPVAKPDNLQDMLTLAAKISKAFDFVRVDFYSDGKDTIVFGELTFTPGDARNKYSDPAFDYRFGQFFKELKNSVAG